MIVELTKLVHRPHPYKTPEGTTKGLLVHLVRNHITSGSDPALQVVDPDDTHVFLE
jgi:hypothetical protein